MKNDQIYLKQIIEHIDELEGYVGKASFEDFEKNSLLQDAVIRKIELIGEGARRLSVDFWEKYKNELPLAEAVSTRNRMIHQYDDIDLRIVWNTIKNDLPRLRERLGEMI